LTTIPDISFRSGLLGSPMATTTEDRGGTPEGEEHVSMDGLEGALMGSDSRKIGATLMIVGAAALVVGSFLPWISAAAPFIGTVNFAGTEGDGKITLVLGIVGLVLGLICLSNPQKTLLWIAGVMGLVGVAVAGYDAGNISNKLGDATASSNGLLTATVGIGLWLSIAGGVVLIVGVLMSMNMHDAAPNSSTQLSPGLLPTASDPVVLSADNTGTNANITWTHTGVKYLLGYMTDPPSYGIWDREVPGPPVLRFPYSEHGKAEAIARFREVEPTGVEVSYLPQNPTGPPVSGTD
jgi:hypothetical protein